MAFLVHRRHKPKKEKKIHPKRRKKSHPGIIQHRDVGQKLGRQPPVGEVPTMRTRGTYELKYQI